MVEQSWEQLVADFQLVCILKRQGKWEDSQRVLHQRLPQTIAAWARCNPKDPAVKKTELEAMFEAEKQRVDDLWLINQIASAQWKEELLPAVRNVVNQEVSRVVGQQFIEMEIQQATPFPSGPRCQHRVPFEDVAGMIDVVQADQRRELSVCP